MSQRPDISRTKQAPGTNQPGPSARRPLRLLVVDDEETVRRSLARYLRRCGHEVDEASDGREALDMVEAAGEVSYDVILSDLKMPIMTGEKLLVHLQQTAGDLHRRMIFLTGDEPSGDAARILAAAGSPVVLKPYELREVLRRVEQLAAGPGGTATAP